MRGFGSRPGSSRFGAAVGSVMGTSVSVDETGAFDMRVYHVHRMHMHMDHCHILALHMYITHLHTYTHMNHR